MCHLPSACVRPLPRPPYHGDKMAAALKGMGYRIVSAPESRPGKGDVLVLWNRYPRDEHFCRAYDAAGASIVVVENGYFGRNFGDSEWYAMALSQHNGCGKLPPPSTKRWNALGIELKPWKPYGKEIILLGTRGMGSSITREPNGWLYKVEHMLRRQQKRQVRRRQHPGPQWVVPEISLEEDLENAWAAITWGSSAGLKALALGVPVFHGLPGWIGGAAAYPMGGLNFDNDCIEYRFLGDREPMFHRVASAMWSLPEIENGKAFKCLLK